MLEHISKSSAADLDKIHAMGVGVTLIPAIYLWKGAHVFADLAEDELDFLSPARQLLDRGVPVSAGTDAVPYDPLHCMWAMVTRRARSGRPMGPRGALSNEQALRKVTTNGAWLTFEEHEKGPLSPGYFAAHPLPPSVASQPACTRTDPSHGAMRYRATGHWGIDCCHFLSSPQAGSGSAVRLLPLTQDAAGPIQGPPL